jgi:hypothetical protein
VNPSDHISQRLRADHIYRSTSSDPSPTTIPFTLHFKMAPSVSCLPYFDDDSQASAWPTFLQDLIFSSTSKANSAPAEVDEQEQSTTPKSLKLHASQHAPIVDGCLERLTEMPVDIIYEVCGASTYPVRGSIIEPPPRYSCTLTQPISSIFLAPTTLYAIYSSRAKIRVSCGDTSYPTLRDYPRHLPT